MGIKGVGLKNIALANNITGSLTPYNLATPIWEETPTIATAASFDSFVQVEEYLKNIVSIYTLGEVYDLDANIINMDGVVKQQINAIFKRHVAGNINSVS